MTNHQVRDKWTNYIFRKVVEVVVKVVKRMIMLIVDQPKIYRGSGRLFSIEGGREQGCSPCLMSKSTKKKCLLEKMGKADGGKKNILFVNYFL